MMRAKWGVAVAALCVVLSSCTASRVSRNATIDVSGTVQRRGGVPVSGARLALTREGDAGDVIITVASIGFACLDPKQPPAICHDARYTSTASNGAFTYTLKGKDTQSTFGFSAVLSLTTRLAAKDDEVAGSSTTYRFHVQTEKLSLPLRMWEPVIGARTGPFGARASFRPLPPDLLPRQIDRGAIGYTIEFTRASDVVWQIDGARPTTTFDPRLLEDSIGTMRVIAAASGLHVSEQLGDEIAFALRSGARAYASPLGPPPSRGKSCAVVDDRGGRHPLSPCGLTDGDFGRRFAPSLCAGRAGCAEPRHTSAIIDLGRAQPVDLIVVRGCEEACRVETSTDLRVWSEVGTTDAARAAFAVGSHRAARYMRVSAASVDDLTEVSAWAGRPAVPNASLLVAPNRFPTTSAGGSGGGSVSSARGSGFTWWATLAALLIGLAGGATAVILRNRRTRV